MAFHGMSFTSQNSTATRIDKLIGTHHEDGVTFNDLKRKHKEQLGDRKSVLAMPWSIVGFGRHSGKTLPQIVFTDPDWFFWAFEHDAFKNQGSLNYEAKVIDARARAIRIPKNSAGDLSAEYLIDPLTEKFARMQIVPTSQPQHEGASPAFRKNVIDLSVPRKIAPYDKLGCSNLLSSAKGVLFGSKSARMTQERCGAFFDDPTNFLL